MVKVQLMALKLASELDVAMASEMHAELVQLLVEALASELQLEHESPQVLVLGALKLLVMELVLDEQLVLASLIQKVKVLA